MFEKVDFEYPLAIASLAKKTGHPSYACNYSDGGK